MKLREIFENGGRIVKGVNTTVDVGPDEIKTQAAKFGNTVDKDGYPPTHKRRVKGKSTNVLFNLGEGKFRANDVEEFKPSNNALNDMKTKYLPDWEMLDHKTLQAKYVAQDHREAEAFVRIINRLSEKMDHFCEVTQDVAEVAVKTTTFDVKGLTILDFQIAMVIDKFANDVGIKQVRMTGNFGMHENFAEVEEGKKRKNKKASRSLGGYFFPGYGYYGSGESGDGGGGESVTEAKSSKVLFIGDNVAVVGQEHGKRLQLSDQEAKQVQDIAQRHGAWYEGNGMDRKLTKGIIDDYKGSWDDDLLSPAIKGYPAPFLYVLFSNIKENDTVEGKIGFDPNSTIFDRILDTQPSTNYFPDREFDAETLQKFLKSVSEGPYDFVEMSQAPATEKNVRKFFTQGEQLMWPDNWEQYPNRAGRVAKSVNDLRDQFLATRKAGVYVAGSDHLQAVQQFLDQNKQGMAENFADGKNPGRKGLAKRSGVNTKASVSSLRKTAKSSSGEKQRMAHWLANMKSGKKK